MKAFEPQDYLIFDCIVGSRLYGTNTEKSDTDYRGVANTPLNVVLDLFQGFEQKDSGFIEDDKVIYDLGKFIKLCSAANPNILELLFVPDSHILFSTPTWEKLIENRQYFLSKKARWTFSGYAVSQLNDIKNHRQWFIDSPKQKPTREMFGLTDSPKASGENLGFLESLNLELIDNKYRDEFRREIEYRHQKKAWDNYASWAKNRNPERKRLEELYKYDVKHASHLVRLMSEGKELLLTGKITFPLPNAEEILAIKNGKYQYEEIIEIAETLDAQFAEWDKESKLPYSANQEKLSELYYELITKR